LKKRGECPETLPITAERGWRPGLAMPSMRWTVR
jgi:hypothetical protein